MKFSVALNTLTVFREEGTSASIAGASSCMPSRRLSCPQESP